MEPHRFLRRKAASAYLHKTYGLERAPSTLAKLAVIGGGPVFRRMNRVPLYSIDDLDEWVSSKLSGPMRSTSDAPPFPEKSCTEGPPARHNENHSRPNIAESGS
jgi:hypothetical protein